MTKASYIGVQPTSKQYLERRTSFLATAGQTLVSGLTYIPGYVDVFVNGSKLFYTAFTASSGTGITFLTPLNLNDVVEIKTSNPEKVIDAVKYSELAGTGAGQGASLVGIQDYQQVTLKQLLIDSSNEINVLRLIPPTEWAAILAGTSTFDAKSAFQAAIDTGKSIYAPGVYKIVGSLNLQKLSKLRGDGFNGGSSAGSGCVFYNTGTSPAVVMPITKTHVHSSIEDFFFKASSWDPTTGANGHGLDIVGQLSMSRVQIIGFQKIGAYLHHDASLSGPYESVLTNVRVLYNGQHGLVVGRGANAVTLISCEYKWNGAPSYLTAPSASGNFDGLYVDNYDDGSGYPTYLPEGLTILGGDSSYNSRYGFNIQGVSYGRIMPGYSEFNKSAYDANLGVDLVNTLVQFGRIPAAKVNMAASYAAYQRTNTVMIGGKSYGAANTNTAPQNNFSVFNTKLVLSEDTATSSKEVMVIPDPVTGNATIGGYNGAILTLGSGASVSLPLVANVQFSGVNTTGAGTASLGTNCPASVPTAPYTWVRVLSSDGTVCFMPLFK